MKHVICYLVLVLEILFISCGDNETVKNNVTKPLEETSNMTVSEKVPEPISVSPLASEDFLLPFDKFSWEREFAPEYVMIHFTSAVMVDKEDPYNIDKVKNIFEELEVSINYIIDRNGDIRCYIPEYRAAWHAGKGSYKGIEKLTDAMNRYSIGIELVAMGSLKDMSVYMSEEEYFSLDQNLMGFTDEQYASLKLLVEDICERNHIPFDREHVIGHCEYKKEKTDPGELFDWNRIFD
ncbi:MAG: N-acetylmuramoyl-L-alanine amidase [Ruminococcaceae bacterium]|nr:N-acetylmuramoyl-L-alanine amidase [Oscillospiraceae bacterium]